MENSLIENHKTSKTIFNNFRISKNIPIDERFIISSLDTIDIEIPLKRRYNGLIFFVFDSVINDGTDDILTGTFYCFETDLTKPIPLHELSLRQLIYQISFETEDYSSLLVKLNKSFPKAGKIIHVKNLDVCYIYDNNTWKYFSGIYRISEESVFDTIPDILSEENKLVEIKNKETSETQNKLITKVTVDETQRKILIDEVQILDEAPLNPLGNRYYIINGFLHYCLMGVLYKLNDKIYVKNISLIKGENILTHNLNSTYILLILRFNSNNGNVSIKSGLTIMNMNYVPIDENSISFESSVDCTNVTTILIAK